MINKKYLQAAVFMLTTVNVASVQLPFRSVSATVEPVLKTIKHHKMLISFGIVGSCLATVAGFLEYKTQYLARKILAYGITKNSIPLMRLALMHPCNREMLSGPVSGIPAGPGKYTALMLAVINGHSEATKYLVSKGANVNEESLAIGQKYNTALAAAIAEEHEPLASWLLENKASPNIGRQTSPQLTVLGMAISKGFFDLVKNLVENYGVSFAQPVAPSIPGCSQGEVSPFAYARHLREHNSNLSELNSQIYTYCSKAYPYYAIANFLNRVALEWKCPICLEGVKGGALQTTVCNHTFHQRCIDGWRRNHANCPSCRQSIL